MAPNTWAGCGRLVDEVPVPNAQQRRPASRPQRAHTSQPHLVAPVGRPGWCPRRPRPDARSPRPGCHPTRPTATSPAGNAPYWCFPAGRSAASSAPPAPSVGEPQPPMPYLPPRRMPSLAPTQPPTRRRFHGTCNGTGTPATADSTWPRNSLRTTLQPRRATASLAVSDPAPVASVLPSANRCSTVSTPFLHRTGTCTLFYT